MFKLLHNGKIIMRASYALCIMKRAELDSKAGHRINSLVIVPDDIDADGSTGYLL